MGAGRKGIVSLERESPWDSPPPSLRDTSPASLRYAGEDEGYGVHLANKPVGRTTSRSEPSRMAISPAVTLPPRMAVARA